MSEKLFSRKQIEDIIVEKGLDGLVAFVNKLSEENEQLRKQKQQYKIITEEYRKTVQHQAELLAEASKQGYCPKVINPVNGEEL